MGTGISCGEPSSDGFDPFGRFQDAWWDKKQDADTHYELFPFSQTQLEQNEYLKQNPGYPDIAR